MTPINSLVTLVIVPREGFSRTRESLDSVFANTTLPFKLIYVDGNSRGTVRRYLNQQSVQKSFQLVRTNYFLTPNRARNIGLQYVDTPYVVFMDNDVVVSPGWLEALVHCANETGATIVGPLMCEYRPLHQRIHFAGGESHIVTDVNGRRHVREKMYKQGHKVVDVRSKLQRCPTELAEFHCTLVRTDIFERIGGFDESMMNTKEHLDFCMTVAQAGGTVYFEPDCIVTYVPAQPRGWHDTYFYMLRWSDRWTLDSLNYFRQKWNLAEDGYFQTKFKRLGWRRRQAIISPLCRCLTFGRSSNRLSKWLCQFDRALNRVLTDRYARQLAQQKPIFASPLPEERGFSAITPWDSH